MSGLTRSLSFDSLTPELRAHVRGLKARRRQREINDKLNEPRIHGTLAAFQGERGTAPSHILLGIPQGLAPKAKPIKGDETRPQYEPTQSGRLYNQLAGVPAYMKSRKDALKKLNLKPSGLKILQSRIEDKLYCEAVEEDCQLNALKSKQRNDARRLESARQQKLQHSHSVPLLTPEQKAKRAAGDAKEAARFEAACAKLDQKKHATTVLTPKSLTAEQIATRAERGRVAMHLEIQIKNSRYLDGLRPGSAASNASSLSVTTLAGSSSLGRSRSLSSLSSRVTLERATPPLKGAKPPLKGETPYFSKKSEWHLHESLQYSPLLPGLKFLSR